METKDRGSLAEEMMEDALLLEELRPARRRQLYLMVKRAQDLFLSLLALVVLSPVLLLIALAVVIDDPRGGPLFTQTRCGQWGKEFRLYKFRTMYIDAEERLEALLPYNEMTGPAFKIRNDPRVTRFGRLLRSMGLDELPQLLNILRGDMSIVGPRPPLPREVVKYTPHQRLRLAVKPASPASGRCAPLGTAWGLIPGWSWTCTISGSGAGSWTGS